MKKTFTYLATGATLIASLSLNAQCNIDQGVNLPEGHVIEVSPSDLAPFCANLEISQDFQLVSKTSSNVTLPAGTFPAQVNSISITDISGLPDGLTFDPTTACPNNCVFTPEVGASLLRGCIHLEGTPTTAFDGDVTITTQIVASIGATSLPVDSFAVVKMQVLEASASECTATGLEDFDLASDLSIYPNPATNNSSISLNLPEGSDVNIEVVNIVGATETQVFNGFLSVGDNVLHIPNVSTLEVGLHLLKIEVNTPNGVKVFTKRFTVE